MTGGIATLTMETKMQQRQNNLAFAALQTKVEDAYMEAHRLSQMPNMKLAEKFRDRLRNILLLVLIGEDEEDKGEDTLVLDEGCTFMEFD